MRPVHDHSAPKKPTNLTINSDLLRKARELDINLSAALEQALETMLRQRLSEQWLAENQEAISAYNAHVEANGVYSNSIRNF